MAYQGNAAHDGNFGGALAPPLLKAWSADLGGTVSYPVIADGLVFVAVGNTGGSYGSMLYALPNQTVPNLVVVKVGAGGMVDLFNFAGQTQVVVRHPQQRSDQVSECRRAASSATAPVSGGWSWRW